jgi:endonuclease/exonuclease/phosphatase (EEP) superfamily protein YafD
LLPLLVWTAAPALPELASAGLRIVSYNVYGANPALERSIEKLKSLEPDFVALQEVTPGQVALLRERLSSQLPHGYFPPPSQGGGLAFLSRLPLHDTSYQPSRHGLNGFAFAFIETGGRRIQVANLHLEPIRTWTLRYKLLLPWQMIRQGSIHRKEIDEVRARLQPGASVIVLGDLNSVATDVAPEQLEEIGLIDSLASFSAPAATHHASVLGFAAEHRLDLDYIFHSTDFQTVDARLVDGSPSDHDFVMATLEWADATVER